MGYYVLFNHDTILQLLPTPDCGISLMLCEALGESKLLLCQTMAMLKNEKHEGDS